MRENIVAVTMIIAVLYSTAVTGCENDGRNGLLVSPEVVPEETSTVSFPEDPENDLLVDPEVPGVCAHRPDPRGFPAIDVSFDYYVNGFTGDDANDGTQSSPLRTITGALSLAATGEFIKVMPGTYSEASGETFPLVIPQGVGLIGDEETKGGGPTPTRIYGGAVLHNNIPSALDPYRDAIVAGFEIKNTNEELTFQISLALRNSGSIIRNNRIVDGDHHAVFVFYGAEDILIAGNEIRNNKGVGIGFIQGGVGTRVENNIITHNYYGVEYDSPGGDLGGGDAQSAGGNVIACNSINDIWTNSGVTIFARCNYWDHGEPTSYPYESGKPRPDIRMDPKTVIHFEGGEVYNHECK